MKHNLETEMEEMLRKIAESKHQIIDFMVLNKLIQKPLISNLQCAEFFATNPRTLLNWRIKHGLRSRKIARRHYYLWSDVFEYIDKNNNQTYPESLTEPNPKDSSAVT